MDRVGQGGAILRVMVVAGVGIAIGAALSHLTGSRARVGTFLVVAALAAYVAAGFVLLGRIGEAARLDGW